MCSGRCESLWQTLTARLRVRRNLAIVFHRAGQTEEAISTMRFAIIVYERTLGIDALVVANCYVRTLM